MAKVINPLMSISASGRLGGLIYQTSRYGNQVKAHSPHTKRPSELQLKQNYVFGQVADEWRYLTESEKEEYNKRAVKLKMTGFNLYIKENLISYGIYGNARYGKEKYS